VTQRSYVVPRDLLPNRVPEWLQERRRRRKARGRVARGLSATPAVSEPKPSKKRPAERHGARNPIRDLRREWAAAMRAKGATPTGRQWRIAMKTARRAERAQ
jgi:hypothetical protein